MTEQRTARRFPVLGIIAFALLAALLLTLAVLSTLKGVRTAASSGSIIRVLDGRTIVVNRDGAEETITLAGVVSPLPAPEGQEPTAENCLADEAKEHLSGILEPGDSIQLQSPDQSDGPRGTRLAAVHHGGEVVNVAMAEAGYAVPRPEQPMEKLGSQLQEAHEAARSEGNGLYSPATPCTLAGRIAPAMAVLEELPEGEPTTSAEADAQIEKVAAAIEQGVTAEKVFKTVDSAGSSLSSLAWAAEAPRLREQLDSSLSAARAELDSLNSTRTALLTAEREEAARRAEQARLAELERQRQAAEAARQAELERQRQAAEAARQEAQREESQRQADEKKKAEEEKKKAEEKKAEKSAKPSPSTSSAKPSPSTSSATPKSESPDADESSGSDEDEDEDEDEDD